MVEPHITRAEVMELIQDHNSRIEAKLDAFAAEVKQHLMALESSMRGRDGLAAMATRQEFLEHSIKDIDDRLDRLGGSLASVKLTIAKMIGWAGGVAAVTGAFMGLIQWLLERNN